MRNAGGEVKSITGFERVLRPLHCESDFPFEHPETLVLLMTVAGIGRSGNVMPSEAFIAFLVELGFGFLFTERHGLLPPNDPDVFRGHLRSDFIAKSQSSREKLRASSTMVQSAGSYPS